MNHAGTAFQLSQSTSAGKNFLMPAFMRFAEHVILLEQKFNIFVFCQRCLPFLPKVNIKWLFSQPYSGVAEVESSKFTPNK